MILVKGDDVWSWTAVDRCSCGLSACVGQSAAMDCLYGREAPRSCWVLCDGRDMTNGRIGVRNGDGFRPDSAHITRYATNTPYILYGIYLYVLYYYPSATTKWKSHLLRIVVRINRKERLAPGSAKASHQNRPCALTATTRFSNSPRKPKKQCLILRPGPVKGKWAESMTASRRPLSERQATTRDAVSTVQCYVCVYHIVCYVLIME